MEIYTSNTFIFVAFIMLLLAFTLAFIRLIVGPTINDRILAMDLIASITIGFVLVYAVLIQNKLYFDIVIIIALISFIGTVGVSYYLKQINEN